MTEVPPASARLTSRLISLDALRGFDMLWITAAGDLLTEALQAFSKGRPPKVVEPANFLATQLDHVDWAGFHFEDLIFPMFVFIAGASAVFSLTKIVANEGRATAMKRILIRTALLFCLGLLYSGGLSNGIDKVRWGGVLQRIALSYCGAGMLFLWLKPRGLIIACLTLLIGYWALLEFVPVPGVGAGNFAKGMNLTNYLDKMYLPGRQYDNLEPEGYLSTLPAIASCLLGVFAGLWLRSEKPASCKARFLIIAGVLMIALGWAWHPWFPVIKKLWTSSFVLVAGGWSAVLLGVFYWLIDVRGWQRWAAPFVWIGMNPITIYLVCSIIDQKDLALRFVGKTNEKWLNVTVHQGVGDLVVALVGGSFVMLFAWFLYRRKIFLRV